MGRRAKKVTRGESNIAQWLIIGYFKLMGDRTLDPGLYKISGHRVLYIYSAIAIQKKLLISHDHNPSFREKRERLDGPISGQSGQTLVGEKNSTISKCTQCAQITR